MKIECLPVGWLRANCYVLWDEESGECAVIDPGGNPEIILGFLKEHGLHCDRILLTHAHDDHSKGVYGVIEGTSAKVCMHRGDVGLTVRRTGLCFQEPADTIFLTEGDEIPVGALTVRVLETPGHTPGGLCFLCEDALFSGDTLFKGSTGRADLGGDFDTELRSLKKLALLEGDYRVFPGHSSPTTLQAERESNPYMLRGMELPDA
ncbi:MAG: MBL fold metallo-hydrolase [Oscillospiraceae bacterium]|nr:MBL fold metallo-hydrolase [Oscillospiraceae bacterium]